MAEKRMRVKIVFLICLVVFLGIISLSVDAQASTRYERAKECIEIMFEEQPQRLASSLGLIFDPSERPNAADLIRQMIRQKVTRGEVMQCFGYECGLRVWEVLRMHGLE